MREYLDKFMSWLSNSLFWLPQLGFGKSWMVGSVRVELWPFIAVALTLAIVWGVHELVA